MLGIVAALLLQSEETFRVDFQIAQMKSRTDAEIIAEAFAKITGVEKSDPKFDEAVVRIQFKKGVTFKPKEFETAIGKNGKLRDIHLYEMSGKVKKKDKTLVFTSDAGVDYALDESDSGGVMGVEQQLPFIEKKVAEGKPCFLITGRLKVERQVDKKSKKETETYRIDVRKATWFSEE
jgi:hypothetical protein